MKHRLDPYFRPAAVLFGGSLLVSFLFGILYYFNRVSTSVYQIGCLLCGVLLYAAAGILFAQKVKKKVLLQALILILLLTVLGFFLTEHTWKSLASLGAKSLVFLTGSILMISHR